jgi:DNA processing protein
MSRRLAQAPEESCRDCARRAWLLGELGAALDFCARDPERLLGALALEDRHLIAALGGRRAAELASSWQRDETAPRDEQGHAPWLCPHAGRFPRALAQPLAPRAIQLRGAAERLGALAAAPVVAIVGSTRASDYGRTVAASLARALAACGVTVASTLEDGIAAAAHGGALRSGGASLGVLDRGLGAPRSRRLETLAQRVARRGCVLTELPFAVAARRWSALASRRTAAALARATIVVEAGERPRELLAALAARRMGRLVAAVPGRITSPLSLATNALIAEGAATMVRSPEEMLDLLDLSCREGSAAGAAGVMLEPALQATLTAVGAGLDTPEKLLRGGREPHELLSRLSELELLGLLTRGDGGRYVPCPMWGACP